MNGLEGLAKEIGPTYAVLLGVFGLLSYVVKRIISSTDRRLEEERKERAEMREAYGDIIHNHMSELSRVLQQLSDQIIRLSGNIESFGRGLTDQMDRLASEIRHLNGRR